LRKPRTAGPRLMGTKQISRRLSIQIEPVK
jgi:hypothetical protein